MKADFIKWEGGNSGEWEICIMKKHEMEHFPNALLPLETEAKNISLMPTDTEFDTVSSLFYRRD